MEWPFATANTSLGLRDLRFGTRNLDIGILVAVMVVMRVIGGAYTPYIPYTDSRQCGSSQFLRILSLMLGFLTKSLQPNNNIIR